MKKQQLTVSDSAYYRIKIQGNLPEFWKDAVGGMRIQVRFGDSGTAVTELEGTVVDHAALFGILSLVYDLGMPLLLVECVSQR